MNRYATQLAAGNYAMWEVCMCCMLTHANGECCAEDHEYEPLSKVPDTADVSMGLLDSEHVETCTRADRLADRCECERLGFRSSDCEGCGSPYHGDRFVLTVVYDMRGVAE